jgi:hypothetical protein
MESSPKVSKFKCSALSLSLPSLLYRQQKTKVRRHGGREDFAVIEI